MADVTVGLINGKVVSNGEPTEPTDAINLNHLQSNFYWKVATAEFNPLATGQTLLYTVPAGKQLILKHVDIQILTSLNPASSFTFSIGIAGDETYDGWISNKAFEAVGIGAIKTFLMGSPATGSKAFAAGAEVKLDIDTAAVADGMTAKIYLWGYLV